MSKTPVKFSNKIWYNKEYMVSSKVKFKPFPYSLMTEAVLKYSLAANEASSL